MDGTQNIIKNKIMFQKGDRVRHINEQIDKQYGIMEVWEIKNGYATCRYGDYSSYGIVTFPVAVLKKDDN